MERSTIQKDSLLVLKASGAETASTDGTGQNIGPTGLVKVSVLVSAVSGTSPTLDLAFQDSAVLASGYASVVRLPQITAVGVYECHVIFTQQYVRYSSTIGGTGTPTFTYEVLVTTKDN